MKRKGFLSLFLCLVFVVALVAPVGVSAADALKLSKALATMEVDSSLVLKLGSVKAEEVSWKSSAKKVAAVSKTGRVTAKSEGVAKITATYKKKAYTCTVTVVDSNKDTAVAPEGVLWKSGNIEVLEEFVYECAYYSMQYLVVRNAGKSAAEVSVSSKAYDKDNNILGSGSSTICVLGAGETSITGVMFRNESGVARCKTTIETYKPIYEPVISGIAYKGSIVKDGVVIDATNNGSTPAEFLEATVVFYKKGVPVYVMDRYMTDGDDELKVGKTITEQFDLYEDFDSYAVYFDGRYYAK